MKRLVASVTILVVLATPGVAWAHDPIFVDDQTAPADSPLIEDGTISFATYGLISQPGEDASLRIRFAAGQTLGVELLVPDREPENAYPDHRHIRMTIATPDGQTTELTGGPTLARFDEPFSKTSYLRLLSHQAPAVAGVTTVTVSSTIPTRFTVATGQIEKFGTTVSDYERVGLDALVTWYQTPPPAAPATTPVTGTATTGTPPTTTTSPDPKPSNGETAAAPPPGNPPGGDPPTGLIAGMVAAGIALVAVVTAGARRRTARRRRQEPR